MKTNKFFLMAAVLVLLASLHAGAMAQGRNQTSSVGQVSLPLPIGSVVKLNAIEVTDGIIGMDNLTKKETAFGYSFFGRTSGDFPGSFTLSMNCAPAVPKPGEGNEVTGGAWTLPIYMTEVRTGYAGSLYGTIVSGTMNWDERGTGANVYVVLKVDGGTQSWNGVSGYATFAGTLLAGGKGQNTTLSGDLVFTIIGAVK